jgi:clumping factor A
MVTVNKRRDAESEKSSAQRTEINTKGADQNVSGRETNVRTDNDVKKITLTMPHRTVGGGTETDNEDGSQSGSESNPSYGETLSSSSSSSSFVSNSPSENSDSVSDSDSDSEREIANKSHYGGEHELDRERENEKERDTGAGTTSPPIYSNEPAEASSPLRPHQQQETLDQPMTIENRVESKDDESATSDTRPDETQPNSPLPATPSSQPTNSEDQQKNETKEEIDRATDRSEHHPDDESGQYESASSAASSSSSSSSSDASNKRNDTPTLQMLRRIFVAEDGTSIPDALLAISRNLESIDNKMARMLILQKK